MATTRLSHAERHGKIYTRAEVAEFYSKRGAAINCRCSQSPVIVDENGDAFAKKLLIKMDQQKDRWELSHKKAA